MVARNWRKGAAPYINARVAIGSLGQTNFGHTASGNMDEWDQAAGVTCPSCGEETLRLIEGRCPSCHRAMIAQKEIQLEDRAERHHVSRLFREGKISVRDLRDARY